MVNKSKIRQSALMLIYSVLENGADTVAFDFDLFWQIAQEKELDRYRTAQAKAVVHACRNAQDSARLLQERVGALLDALQGDLTAARLREDVERYACRSDAFAAALNAHHICLNDARRDGTLQLALCNKDVIRLAAAVEGLGRELLPTLADFPAYRALLEPFAAAIRRRGRMLALCAALETPRALEGGEYAALARSAQALQELRPAAERLARAVLGQRAAFDARLSASLQNYSTERLDVVDKSILYLSLYELEFNKLELPIVISEATALADTFSGSKSAPFIHGVLAALAGA